MMNEIKRNLEKIIGSYLNSFGIVNQFLELSFSNEKYEEIKFFIDCEIKSSDENINKKKLFFDSIDNDVSSLIYFIKANRKQVISVNIIKEKLKIIFSNDYEISFDLKDDFESPLSITFKEKIGSQITSKIIFENNEILLKG